MSKDESIFSFKFFLSSAILTPPVALSLGNESQQKDKSLLFVTTRGEERCCLNYKCSFLKCFPYNKDDTNLENNSVSRLPPNTLRSFNRSS